MKTPTRRSASSQRFEDISELRAKLPRYWWAEVSRVRKLIATDVETGLFEAEHFALAAEALARADASALCAASRQLTAIAQAAARA